MSYKSKPKSQQGVAIILVLVIIALAAIIATQLISMRGIYHLRTQNIVLAENAWGFAVGAETLARIAIDQSLKNEDTVHLGQPWASQSVVFPIDGGQLTASLKDLRGCFNVNMVAYRATRTNSNNNSGQDNQVNQDFDNNKPLPGQKAFQNLITYLSREARENGADMAEASALAARLRDWIDEDSMPTGFEGAEDDEYMGYLQPYRTANQNITSISELRTVSGFNADVLEILNPYICAIPGVNELVINVNTIDIEQPELLASLYENMSPDMAATILASRPADGFTKGEYDPLVPADVRIIPGITIDFTSNYFAAMIEVELGQTTTRLKSLLFYDKAASAVQTLARLGHND